MKLWVGKKVYSYTSTPTHTAHGTASKFVLKHGILGTSNIVADGY